MPCSLTGYEHLSIQGGTLTYKWELVWKYLKDAITVHCKQYSEVHGQTTPYKEVVHSSPVVCVKTNLKEKLITFIV